MVAPAPPDAVVQQDVTAGFVDRTCELHVVALTGVRADRMGAPQEREHVDAPARETGEHLGYLAAGAPERFIAVALEVGEQDAIAGPAGRQVVEQAREVLRAVDEDPDVVALRSTLPSVVAGLACSAPVRNQSSSGTLSLLIHRHGDRAAPTSGGASRSGSDSSTFSSSCGSARPALTASS